MNGTKEEQLQTLSEIRLLMEQSSKFISLSGLAGISAGVIALLGGAVAWMRTRQVFGTSPDAHASVGRVLNLREDFVQFFLLDAGIVFVLALASAIYFTTRKAKKQNLPTWDATAKRLVINLFVPVVAGGIFCLIMLTHGEFQHIAGATLLFYGLGLINASKYTLSEVRWLGYTEILLGLLAAAFPGWGLIFWMTGFGVLHILYGSLMYFKYER